VQNCAAHHLPAVIDAHRINFTGPWAGDALAELDALLTDADRLGARYLTTVELGDAVRSGGRFVDASDGRERSLTPVGTVTRRLTRRAGAGR
jgi:hypothetical protein